MFRLYACEQVVSVEPGGTGCYLRGSNSHRHVLCSLTVTEGKVGPDILRSNGTENKDAKTEPSSAQCDEILGITKLYL